MMNHWKATRPRATHWREVSCKDVDCLMYINGWETILPWDDIVNIDCIRRSGLAFREERDGQLIRFRFAPGQECFTGRAGEHRVQLEIDPVFRRNNQVMAPLEWMDRMNDNLYYVKMMEG